MVVHGARIMFWADNVSVQESLVLWQDPIGTSITPMLHRFNLESNFLLNFVKHLFIIIIADILPERAVHDIFDSRGYTQGNLISRTGPMCMFTYAIRDTNPEQNSI